MSYDWYCAWCESGIDTEDLTPGLRHKKCGREAWPTDRKISERIQESGLTENIHLWCLLSKRDKALLVEVGKENLVMWVDGVWKCQKDSQPGWNTSCTYRIKREYLK